MEPGLRNQAGQKKEKDGSWLSSILKRREKKSPGDDLLSHQWTGSIIGAGGLNFRVRNGIGWIPSAVVTRTKYVRKQVKRES